MSHILEQNENIILKHFDPMQANILLNATRPTRKELKEAIEQIELEIPILRYKHLNKIKQIKSKWDDHQQCREQKIILDHLLDEGFKMWILSSRSCTTQRPPA